VGTVRTPWQRAENLRGTIRVRVPEFERICVRPGTTFRTPVYADR
jgi:hypothetical protein